MAPIVLEQRVIPIFFAITPVRMINSSKQRPAVTRRLPTKKARVSPEPQPK
jgi:hypothetical protein